MAYKGFFLPETAFHDVWEHVVKLCYLLQPPNPQKQPPYPPKVKFFIYGAVLIKFEKQNLYMFNNNS